MATWEVITEKLQTEKLAAESASDAGALNQVLQAVGSANSADEAARLALDTVRDAFGWAYGSYWKVDPIGPGRSSSCSSRATPARSSARSPWPPPSAEGVGLSGRAWKTARPVLHPATSAR